MIDVSKSRFENKHFISVLLTNNRKPLVEVKTKLEKGLQVLSSQLIKCDYAEDNELLIEMKNNNNYSLAQLKKLIKAITNNSAMVSMFVVESGVRKQYY